MKNVILFTIFIFVAAFIVSIRYFIAPEMSETLTEVKQIKKLPTQSVNAVWDWSFENRGENTVFIDSLNSMGVNLVYLNISGYIDIFEQADPAVKEIERSRFIGKITEYISIANGKDIKVQALIGNKEWGNASHRYLNQIAIDFVEEYNATHPEGGFSGIQFDIESYNQDNFTAQNQQVIFSEFLDTVEQITKRFGNLQGSSVNFSSLELGFAIPYWFDGENGNIEKVYWNGEEKHVLYHLLNRLNTVQNGYIVIMAYRNFADGTDGVIEHSKNEVNFLRDYLPRVRIIIGQELTNVQPKKITYFGKSFKYMLGELDKITAVFEESQNFVGFAYHQADALSNFK